VVADEMRFDDNFGQASYPTSREGGIRLNPCLEKRPLWHQNDRPQDCPGWTVEDRCALGRVQCATPALEAVALKDGRGRKCGDSSRLENVKK
jgi:hypothetical protein